jgi:hypothetical protein
MPKDTQFPVLNVCREDLELLGFDTTQVDDHTMMMFAHRLSKECMEGFFDSLRYLAEDFDLPRVPPEPSK